RRAGTSTALGTEAVTASPRRDEESQCRHSPRGRRASQAAPDRCANYGSPTRPRCRHDSLLFERRPRPPARADSGSSLRRMSAGKRGVSFIVQRDGALQARTYRISLWVLRGLGVVAVTLVVLLV